MTLYDFNKLTLEEKQADICCLDYSVAKGGKLMFDKLLELKMCVYLSIYKD
ncbi:hypothetical protein MWU50_06445 [Flavobacteriaceae bacterium S0862]|nr:hypothetical protein [Flavobacteriaceae bacterium S0862]